MKLILLLTLLFLPVRNKNETTPPETNHSREIYQSTAAQSLMSPLQEGPTLGWSDWVVYLGKPRSQFDHTLLLDFIYWFDIFHFLLIGFNFGKWNGWIIWLKTTSILPTFTDCWITAGGLSIIILILTRTILYFSVFDENVSCGGVVIHRRWSFTCSSPEIY